MGARATGWNELQIMKHQPYLALPRNFSAKPRCLRVEGWYRKSPSPNFRDEMTLTQADDRNNRSMHVYVCIYVYIYIYTCACILFIYTYIHTYMCISKLEAHWWFVFVSCTWQLLRTHEFGVLGLAPSHTMKEDCKYVQVISLDILPTQK